MNKTSASAGTIKSTCQIAQSQELETAGSETIKRVKMIMMIMMKKYVLIALFFNEQTCTIGSVHEMLRVGARSTVLLAKLWLCS